MSTAVDLGHFYMLFIIPLGLHTVFLVARKSRVLELLAFDEYCRFDTPAFFWGIKRGSVREGKLSNPRGRAARARYMEKIYGNLRKPARGRRAHVMH